MKASKLHSKLRWETIIDRLNKEAGFEKFVKQGDAIYMKGLVIDHFELSSKPVYENRSNPVFPALTDRVRVDAKIHAKKVYDKNSLLFIANTASDKELFIDKYA